MIMSRLVPASTLLILACAGCLPVQTVEVDRILGNSVSTTRPMPAPTPVNPKQVTRENARDVSSALWDELDRAEQDEFLPANNSPTPKKKK